MQRLLVFFAVLVMLAVAVPIMAQDAPSVEVTDQVSFGTVNIDSVYSDGPGFVVIHQDNGEGSFGAVIGHRAVNAGWSFDVSITIDGSMTTSTLYAMLHTDTGEAGVYEFGTVDGADGPVVVDGAPVSPAFNVDMLHVTDQIIEDGMVTISNVTVQADGFVVIHADADGSFGPVIGSAPVTAGQNSDVVVEVDMDGVTDALWPMLHVDTGEAGVYEFGTVEGADGPVVVNGTVAVKAIWVGPFMRVADQIVLHSDGMDMMDMAPTLTAESVVAQDDGFLVIHSEADGGGPGPVAGFTPVTVGLNTNVVVELDPELTTPVLYPMLHVDTGEAGVYEFGTVEGADGPVIVDGAPLVFPIHAAPSLQMTDQPMIEAMMGVGPHVYIDSALIDAQGWIAIHSSVDGSPGPVIASVPIVKGLNTRVLVELDPEEAGSQIFPMLHYDTGELGVYEFGTVDGADSPVVVGGSPVVGPLNITESMMDDMGDDMGDDTMDDMEGCNVSSLSGQAVNLRSMPSTSSEVAGSLIGSEMAYVSGQAMGDDGFIWWSLERGSWVRSDIVSETADCDMVPTVDSGMDGMMDDSMEPAATEEAGS